MDTAWERAVSAGAEVICPLEDQFYGERGSRLRDPFGQHWMMPAVTGEISLLDTVIADLLEHHQAYRALRQLPGIGPVLAAVIAAEIGDITRFSCPARLCSWAGLTPRHRESDLKVARGHITKQGSTILRWALVEAIQHQPDGSPVREIKDRIIARRGKEATNIAKTAAARKLLTCVFYAMRDGQVRSLAARSRAADAA